MKKLVVLTGIALAAAVVNEKLKDATRPHISHVQIFSEGQTQEFAVRGFVKGTSFKELAQEYAEKYDLIMAGYNYKDLEALLRDLNADLDEILRQGGVRIPDYNTTLNLLAEKERKEEEDQTNEILEQWGNIHI